MKALVSDKKGRGAAQCKLVANHPVVQGGSVQSVGRPRTSIVTSECERDDSEFILVAVTARFSLARLSASTTSSTV